MSNTATSNELVPWVEKYRPTKFDDIVLDPVNREVFQNILSNNYFPNLLFYGPPGTGKTTTIINLINEYNSRYKKNSRGSVIHLNASDERGIDIIRNQIFQFVRSNNFFDAGLKFVILDEVDYMTKNAQHALKYLLQTSSYNVRYCLICNYISKIEDSLRNEFICIRFNQLPKQDIYTFIRQMLTAEEIQLDDETIHMIQDQHNSDIRSMINFIQLNQNVSNINYNILSTRVWDEMHKRICDIECTETSIIDYIHNISIQYNIDKKTILKKYLNHVIRENKTTLTSDFFNIVGVIMHMNNHDTTNIVSYMTTNLREYYTKTIVGHR